MTHTHDHHHQEHITNGSCRRYLDSLSDYVDGTLADALCHEIETHMSECENCRIVINTLSKTVLLYKQLPRPEVPSDVKERLYKVLDIQSLLGSQPAKDDPEAGK